MPDEIIEDAPAAEGEEYLGAAEEEAVAPQAETEPAIELDPELVLAATRRAHAHSEARRGTARSFEELTEGELRYLAPRAAAVLEEGPSGPHERWRARMIAEGWTEGAAKDRKRRTSPLIVPFERLPEVDQLAAHAFAEAVLGRPIARPVPAVDPLLPPPFPEGDDFELRFEEFLSGGAEEVGRQDADPTVGDLKRELLADIADASPALEDQALSAPPAELERVRRIDEGALRHGAAFPVALAALIAFRGWPSADAVPEDERPLLGERVLELLDGELPGTPEFDAVREALGPDEAPLSSPFPPAAD